MAVSLRPSTLRRLEQAARSAAALSYSPYSKFPVGSAVLTPRGKIYSACNVENAAYSLCSCAERGAISAAVSAGERAIAAIVVYTPTAIPTTPCGACRQVINEFGPDALVISICHSPERLESPLSALLPHAFGPRNLVSASRRPSVRKAR
jgi:cytidine deaminase